MPILTVAGTSDALAFVDADPGAANSFQNIDDTELWVQNVGGQTRTLTLETQSPCSHGFTVDKTFPIPPGIHRVRPIDMNRYNDENQMVNFSFDSVTDISVAAQRTGY